MRKNQRKSPQVDQKKPRSQSPKKEVLELHDISEFCLLCQKLCKFGSDNSVCQSCSEPVKQQATKLNLTKKKLSQWQSLTQDRLKSPLIRLFEED